MHFGSFQSVAFACVNLGAGNGSRCIWSFDVNNVCDECDDSYLFIAETAGPSGRAINRRKFREGDCCMCCDGGRRIFFTMEYEKCKQPDCSGSMCSGRGYNIYIRLVAAEGAGDKGIHRRNEGRRSAIKMRARGVEPPRPFGHKVLSLARMPVPPRSHKKN